MYHCCFEAHHTTATVEVIRIEQRRNVKQEQNNIWKIVHMENKNSKV